MAREPAARVLAVIVNYNRAELTVTAVESLMRDAPRKAEVSTIVIDSGSEPDDFAALSHQLPGSVELIRLARNRGYAAAANDAARRAFDRSYEFMWLLNNDIELPPGGLDTMLEALEAAPDVAAVAPAIVTAQPPTEILSAGYRIDLALGRVRHNLFGRDPRLLGGTPFAVDGLEGSAMLFRTVALRSIGPLDEGFFMYWEDVEWSHRARNAGWRLLVVPSVHVLHLQAQSSPAPARIELMIRNRVRFMRIAASWAEMVIFLTYFSILWLPAYVLFRLIPRAGWSTGIGIAYRAIAWNIRDARRHSRWRLAREDQSVDP